MRWTETNKPVVGDFRRVLRFAWFPKRVGQGTIVWLEKYVSDQLFSHYKVPGPGHKGTRNVIDWKEIKTWVWSGEGLSIITNR